MQTYSLHMLALGQLFYLSAIFFRFFRLYVVLGYARPLHSLQLLLAHCIGISLGYCFGILFYEISIITLFFILKQNATISAFASLLLIRLLDALVLFLLSICFMPNENVQLLVPILCLLFISVGFLFFSFATILRRIEKKILEFTPNSGYDLKMLKGIHEIRRQILRLSWNRKGNISIIIVLTIVGWLSEWTAFFCLQSTTKEALIDMIDRVNYSFRFITKDTMDVSATLTSLQSAGFWLTIIVAVCLVFNVLRSLKTSRD